MKIVLGYILFLVALSVISEPIRDSVIKQTHEVSR